MHANLASKLVDDYESGRLSRRQLVARLLGLGAALATMEGTAMAQETETSTFSAKGLDHIALNVTDVARSSDFYTRHLGLRVLRGNGQQANFLGGERDFFLALFRSEKPGLNHYCYGIPNYDPDEVMEKLAAAGLRPRREQNRVYFPDPDGITVQLAQI